MTRLEVFIEALCDAWRTGTPDGHFFRLVMEEIDKIEKNENEDIG